MKFKKKFNRLSRILLPFLVFSLILTGFVFFIKSSFFEIGQVSCFLNSEPCLPEWNFEILRQVSGRNLIFYRQETLEKYLLKKENTIAKVSVHKVWPAKIRVEMTRREAVLAAKMTDQEKYYLIDSEGVFLGLVSQVNLPVIVLNESLNLKPGEKFSQSIVWIAKATKELNLRQLTPSAIKILSADKIEIIIDNRTPVLFSGRKDLNYQLDSLQLIFTRAKIEGRTIKRLDLRFDKPVLVYE